MKKILVVALAFSTLYITSCKSGGSDPKSVLSSFFDAMAKKDFAAAIKLATKDSKTTLEALEEDMKMNGDDMSSEQFDRSKIEIGQAIIDGDKAIVNVKGKKSGSGDDFILKKEGGEWKVAMDLGTLLNMGAQKMKKEGMTEEMKELQEIQKIMDTMRDKNRAYFDSLKKALEKN